MHTQEKVLHPALLSHLPDEMNLRCLDAGCGDGGITALLNSSRPTWELTAGDLPGQSLNAARTGLADLASVLELDLTKKLPFKEREFDVAVSICTFMWLDDSQFDNAAQEVLRVLSDSGRLLLIDVHPDWQGEKLADGIPADGKTVPVGDSWRNEEISVWWRSSQTYRKLLENAGFQVTLTDVPIPPNHGLAPRYENKAGSSLYLLAEAAKP